MTGREFVWHLFRVALAAALLAWDVRFFLFYLFLIALRILHALERLRAIARVFQIGTESKLLAVADSLGVPEEVIQRRYEGALAELTPEQRRALEQDMARALGSGYIA